MEHNPSLEADSISASQNFFKQWPSEELSLPLKFTNNFYSWSTDNWQILHITCAVEQETDHMIRAAGARTAEPGYAPMLRLPCGAGVEEFNPLRGGRQPPTVLKYDTFYNPRLSSSLPFIQHLPQNITKGQWKGRHSRSLTSLVSSRSNKTRSFIPNDTSQVGGF